MDERQPYPRGIFGARDRAGKLLPSGTRVLLSVLWSFARWWEDGDPWVYPSPTTLERLTGFASRSVWRSLSQLVEAGAARRERRFVGGRMLNGWTLTRLEAPDLPDADEADRGVTDDRPRGQSSTDRGVSRALTEGSPGTDRGVTESLTEGSGVRVSEESGEAPKESKPPSESATVSVLVDGVIEHLTAAQRKLNARGGTRSTPKNRAKIQSATKREQATLEDWQTVIDWQFANVRKDPSKWKYLCLSTICRPDNFARAIESPHGTHDRGGGARHSPSTFSRPSKPAPVVRPTLDEDDIPL